MPGYRNGKIYNILNNIDGETYVGSTINTLSRRMAHHRSETKRNPQNKLYKHMHELDVDNFYIEPIENYPCNDAYELRAREGYYIREIGTLNANASCRTPLECIEYKNQYWDKHIERYNEEKRKYRSDNKDEYNEKRRSRYQENKEISKAYYNKNKEQIKQQRHEKKQHDERSTYEDEF